LVGRTPTEAVWLLYRAPLEGGPQLGTFEEGTGGEEGGAQPGPQDGHIVGRVAPPPSGGEPLAGAAGPQQRLALGGVAVALRTTKTHACHSPARRDFVRALNPCN